MTEKLLPKPSASNQTVNDYVRAVEHGLKAQHIIAVSGGWAIRTMGSSGSSRVFISQQEAVREAKKKAMINKADIFIHGRDGKIRSRV